MRNRSPHQSRTRPLPLPHGKHLGKVRIGRRRKRLIALRERSFQPRENRILVRSFRRRLHHIRRSRMVGGSTASRLRLGHMIHHPRKRPHLRRRLVLVLIRRHLLRRLQNVVHLPRLRTLHLSGRPSDRVSAACPSLSHPHP